MYKIQIEKNVIKLIKKLPDHIQKKFLKLIENLEKTPYIPGYKKLKNSQNIYRVRLGNYRVIYKIENDILIIIILIGHRKNIYQNLKN